MLIGAQITAAISEAAAKRLGGCIFIYLGRGPLLAMIPWGDVTPFVPDRTIQLTRACRRPRWAGVWWKGG